MKKKILIIIIALIILAIAIFFIIKGFNKEDDSTLKKVSLAEVTHSSFYTPLYVAIENGYFEDEGLEIELILTPGADKVSAALLSGDVEIGFAGAESAIYVYEQNNPDYLQIFSGLTKRDGQFIVSRDNYEDFSLEDLYGKEILVGRSTGMPALNFLNGLKNMGIDIDRININYSVEFAALSGTFIGGTGDFVNLFEPNATSLEENGYGKVVASVGEMSGEVPYTAFYARKSYIEENSDIIDAFTKAIAKGIEYTMNNDSSVVAEDIIAQFPDTDVDELALMIDRYKEYDCFLTTPFVSEEIFTNLEDFLIDFELIENYVPYNDLVNNFYHE